MAYTENDVYENIVMGNVYLKPNIQGTFSYIVDSDTLFNVDRWNISDGSIAVTGMLQGPNNPPKAYYSYFKDDSYLKLTLNETWDISTGILTSLGYTAVLGIKDATTGTIDEVSMSNVGGLPTSKTIYTLNLSLQHWDVEQCLYTQGDMFRFSLCWWSAPSNKLRMLFIPASVSTASYSYASHLGHLDENIMTGGVQSVLQLITTDGQKIASFFCGQTSEGTQYPDEDSETGGGHGTFYNRNDEIHATPLPSLQAIDFGFTSLYNPNPSDMRAICRWLWSDDFTDNIKKNFVSPFENILGFNFVALPEGTLSVENGKLAIDDFVIGNSDSNIQTLKITNGNQYLDLDCGTVEIPEYWQNFIDYDTNFVIWLPYIGFRQLKPCDILQEEEHNGCYVNVIYHIDLLTGCAVAEIVSAIKERETGYIKEHVLYSFSTNVFYSTPISGANYMSMYNQQLTASLNSISNVVNSIKKAVGEGDLIGGITSLFTGQAQSKRDYETAKPEYGRGGANGGNSGYFSYKKPYIIRTQPIAQTPKNYKSMVGVPSQIYYTLSELTGYTEIETVITDTLNSCTEDEKNEIVSLLKGGVIL